MPPRLHGGAVGTELARRGFELRAPQWSAAANLAAPRLVAQIHRDYADAGAALVTANTTSVHEHTVGDAVVQHCAIAIALARESGVEVAGSLAMLPRSIIDPDERRRQYARVAQALVGCDVLLLEGFLDPHELLLALSSTRDWPGPRWAALAGPAVPRIAEVIAARPADVAMFVVHCCPLDVADAALAAVRAIDRDVALGAYPSPNGDDAIFARELLLSARAHDLAWIGSCCGSTPDTTAALANVATS
jgi:homocysteine S-methyltransferase